MTTCTQTQIDQGVTDAKAYNADRVAKGLQPLAYAAINGRILSEDGSIITFQTGGEDSAMHTFRLTKDPSICWAGCPSTARNGDGTGTLYISTIGAGVTSVEAPYCHIYGTTPGAPLVSFKWPNAGLGEAPTYELELVATSIVITGYAAENPELHAGKIELLDASLAGMKQDLVLRIGENRVTIRATDNGLGAFQMPVPDSTSEIRRKSATAAKSALRKRRQRRQ